MASTDAPCSHLVRATLRYLHRQCAELHVAWGTLPLGEDFAATGVLRVAAPVMGSRGGIKIGCFPLYEAPRWLLGTGLISRRGGRREQTRANLVTRWDPARAPPPLPTRARPGLMLVMEIHLPRPHDG